MFIILGIGFADFVFVATGLTTHIIAFMTIIIYIFISNSKGKILSSIYNHDGIIFVFAGKMNSKLYKIFLGIGFSLAFGALILWIVSFIVIGLQTGKKTGSILLQ